MRYDTAGDVVFNVPRDEIGSLLRDLVYFITRVVLSGDVVYDV